MNNSFELRCRRPGCSSDAVMMCVCANSISLMCEDCIPDHMCQPGSHNFIKLDQSQDNIRKSQNPQIYTTIETQILEYIQDIDDIKSQVEVFKGQILNQLEQRFASAIDYLDEFILQAEVQLKTLKDKGNVYSKTKNELLIKFKEGGLSKLLHPYLEEFELNQTQIQEALDNLILCYPENPFSLASQSNKQPPIQENYQIFIPKLNTKNIIQYNSKSKQTRKYDLSNSIEDVFSGTSTCILPNEDVIIVGGSKPPQSTGDVQSFHGNAYRFSPATGSCTKLGNLNNPRSCTYLYVNDKYVYAFGGIPHSNQAERMDWTGNKWCNLPDMNAPRAGFGSYYKDFKLYLMGGIYSDSVEYYDFKKNSFSILEEVTVPIGRNLVATIDDRIYILNKHLLVLSEKFKVVGEERYVYPYGFLNLSDIIVQGSNVLFYDRESQNLHLCNTKSQEVKRLIKI